jgi:hypothetical protein
MWLRFSGINLGEHLFEPVSVEKIDWSNLGMFHCFG